MANINEYTERMTTTPAKRTPRKVASRATASPAKKKGPSKGKSPSGVKTPMPE